MADTPEGIERKDTPVQRDAQAEMDEHARDVGVHPRTGETEAEQAAAQSDGDRRLRGEDVPDRDATVQPGTVQVVNAPNADELNVEAPLTGVADDVREREDGTDRS